MASRTGRVFSGLAIGAAPGIALFLIGIVVGGEAMLSFGVIGILLAIVGAVVGAIVGGSTKDGNVVRLQLFDVVVGCVGAARTSPEVRPTR